MGPTFDLAVNLPPRSPAAAFLTDRLAGAALRSDDLAYPDPAGAFATRESVTRWLARHAGVESPDPRRMTLTLGARHALGLALARSIAGRPLRVAVEAHTYQGFRAIAQASGVACVDVAMDARGMCPDALEDTVRRTGARVVYVQPALQNPTTATLPLDRRREIVALARDRDLTLIEGDVYAPLGEAPMPALASLAPERTFHAGGIGKVLGPGLRLGWLLHPDEATQVSTAARLQREHDGLPGFWPGLIARSMDDGTLDAYLRALRPLLADRVALARRVIGGDLVAVPGGLHAWLPHPDARGLADRLAARGVSVAPPQGLVAAGSSAGGVRLALGAEQDMERLEAALRHVAAAR